jgi:hypothetical protein
MLRRIWSSLTYANVASTIALVAALGTGSAYAANTVFSTDIVDGEVKHADLASNSVTSVNIYPGSVTTSDIHDDGVDNTKILDGAVNSASVFDNSLTNADLGVDSVQATEIADGSIDSGEISDNSLFAQDLAPSSVGTSELADGGIGNADIASNAVNGSKVSNNTLTTADIAGTDASGAISLGAGSVANGRCKSYDISVPGAVAGQGVMIATKAALQAGMVIYGQRVPAADTVTMTVCNLSGTTMDAITNLPIRTITFG